jgi:hypothetical protein
MDVRMYREITNRYIHTYIKERKEGRKKEGRQMDGEDKDTEQRRNLLMHCLWQSKLTQPHWQTFCQE